MQDEPLFFVRWGAEADLPAATLLFPPDKVLKVTTPPARLSMKRAKTISSIEAPALAPAERLPHCFQGIGGVVSGQGAAGAENRLQAGRSQYVFALERRGFLSPAASERRPT